MWEVFVYVGVCGYNCLVGFKIRIRLGLSGNVKNLELNRVWYFDVIISEFWFL